MAKSFRPKVQQPRFVRLRSLRCFEEVVRLIKMGTQLVQIARLIQGHHKEYQDVTEETLLWTLREYRATLPASEVASTAPGADEIALGVVIEPGDRDFADGLDEVKEIERLYLNQVARIERLTKIEAKVPFPMRGLVAEFAVAAQLLKTSADLKSQRLTTGVETASGEEAAAEKPSQRVEQEYGTPVANVLAQPDGRRKVLSLLDRIRKLPVVQAEQLAKAVGEEAGDPDGGRT